MVGGLLGGSKFLFFFMSLRGGCLGSTILLCKINEVKCTAGRWGGECNEGWSV